MIAYDNIWSADLITVSKGKQYVVNVIPINVEIQASVQTFEYILLNIE